MVPNIPLRVKNLLRKYGTTDPYQIAKEMNIEIVFSKTPNKINGFWRRVLRRKYICINEDLSEWQRKAVLGHELGHLVLHPRYKNYCMAGRTYYAKTRHEDEADEFSIILLSYSTNLEKQTIAKFLKDGYKVTKYF